MEFLRVSRRKTIVSEIIYILLNILMAVAILIVVLTVQSPVPAFLLVLLSKWRVFAVRPQHWVANVVSNIVDAIVSVSFVVFLYMASGAFTVQIILTILYIAWLLLLKPRSNRTAVVLQAGVGQFVGVSALMHVSYDWWAWPVVLLMWLIGYSTARHTLVAYRESHFALLSLIWGLVVAELGWLLYHWNFAYDFNIAANLVLSQAAIIVGLFGFLAERAYASIHEHGSLQRQDIILPATLVVSSLLVLLTLFGRTEGL